jgi:hypothetical protein
MDVHGHGTHCSRIANAVTNNQIGVAGVSWSSKILPLRAGFAIQGPMGIYGVLEEGDIANAFVYAILAETDVISMSWGGPETLFISDVIQSAYSENIVLIAAAGNSSTSNIAYFFPAAYEEVCAVAATVSSDQRATYSNYGVWIDVCAPGGTTGAGILSTLPNNSYGAWMGTSMACPHVAGLAGLIKGLYNNLNPTHNAIVNSIVTSADNIDVLNPEFEGLLGSGRINLERALNIPLIDGAPAERRIYLHPRERQEFSAIVYNLTGNPVTYSWELDGEIVSTRPTYVYTASAISNNILRVNVTLDGETNFYEWTIVTANSFVEGAVSGTWILDHSPYIVTGDISIPTGQTLTIEPGVDILFDGLYKFYVYGQLNATGTEENIITFSRYQPIGEWLGIDFIDTEQENRLEYCLVEYVASFRGAIYCDNSSPLFINSTISNNNGFYGPDLVYAYGRGFYLLESSPIISNCTIINNVPSGICSDNSNPVISNNSIFLTPDFIPLSCSPGINGIACINNSAPIIHNNTIFSIMVSGYTYICKGILCMFNSSPIEIINNTIVNNGTGEVVFIP